MFKKHLFPPTFINLALFTFLWLYTGFSMGTATLMGPVRWITDYSRNNQWSHSKEDILVKIIVVMFVVTSFLIAVWLLRVIIKTKLKIFRWIIPACLSICFGFSLAFWFNPKFTRIEDMEETEENIGELEFIFGSYPELEKIQVLKNNGYFGIISLLHPAVVPFEPMLLEHEKDNAKKVGIKFFHIPMLPWVADNKNSKEKLEEIIENYTGKFYVHCYLGKDRVNVFKNFVKAQNQNVESEMPSNIRYLFMKERFERGPVYELKDEVYFTPYPTEEEYSSYLLNGFVQSVVSIQNPDNPRDTNWINKESNLLKKFNIDFILLPLKDTLNGSLLDFYADSILKLKKPLVVHGFRTPSSKTFALRWRMEKLQMK